MSPSLKLFKIIASSIPITMYFVTDVVCASCTISKKLKFGVDKVFNFEYYIFCCERQMLARVKCAFSSAG